MLLQVVQSLSATAGPAFGGVQNVALLNSNPQYDGGLQHPDCKTIQIGLETHSMVFRFGETRTRTIILRNIYMQFFI